MLKNSDNNHMLMGSPDFGYVLSLHRPDGTNYANVRIFAQSLEEAAKIATPIVMAEELMSLCEDAVKQIQCQGHMNELGDVCGMTYICPNCDIAKRISETLSLRIWGDKRHV